MGIFGSFGIWDIWQLPIPESISEMSFLNNSFRVDPSYTQFYLPHL